MIALIAGTGFLPISAARDLQVRGEPFFILSLFPADNGTALQQYGPVISHNVYKLSLLLDELVQRGSTEAFIIGKVDKRHLLAKLSYDWLLTKLLAKALFKNDSGIIQLLIDELAAHNITVLSQRELLKDLFVPAGVYTGTLTTQIETDITLGMKIAEQLSISDVGQTVVVKNGMVLAVEAIEGTDECIARGVQLGGAGVVVCKTARTTHGDQCDIPTLGPATLASYAPGQIAAIAWHSNRTMIAQYQDFIESAEQKKITLVCRQS